MRIAVDARPLARPNTGIGRYTDCLLKEMTARDHQWWLLSGSPLETGLAERANVSVVAGAAGPDSPQGLVHSLYSFRRWSLRRDIDLFWSPRHHLPLLLPRRIRTVLTIHDVLWKRNPETMRMGNRVTERVLMPHAIRRADEIVCVSRFTRREVAGFWPSAAARSSVVYSGGLADAVADDSRVPKQRYFLFVGTLEPRKNLRSLLRAFQRLRAAGNRADRLVIAGGQGWGNIRLGQWIRELDLEAAVTVLGSVSDGELAALYRGALAVVMPSLYEGCGLPVIEALQFGTPAITARDSAPAEMAGSAGLSCDPLSIVDMAETLARLANDAECRASLSARARERAELFSWRGAAAAMLELMEGKRPPTPPD